MNNTEEDTFRTLSRPSLDEMITIFGKKYWSIRHTPIFGQEAFLAEYGWDYKEFADKILGPDIFAIGYFTNHHE